MRRRAGAPAGRSGGARRERATTRYEPVYPKHTWMIAGEDVPAFEADMAAVCARRERGTDFARLIPTRHVATGERVTLKCRIPPCECYGHCLMDPPFSPTAEDGDSSPQSLRRACEGTSYQRPPTGTSHVSLRQTSPL